MPYIQTADLTQGSVHPAGQQIYNGLDCCLTLEVWEQISALSEASQNPSYHFARALQAPILEMMLRGFKINQEERHRGIALLSEEITKAQSKLDKLAFAVWNKPLNPNSPKQVIEFFYQTMRLPEVWSSKKGEKKLSTDREALEKLSIYLYARPIISIILSIRDMRKQLSVLQTEIDSDGRMRTSFNIGGTETGRLSSSGSAEGTGTNFQNITEKLRRMFEADKGFKLCGIDLEQAESREVGWQCGTLFDDWSYLDACESGDLHTTVCKMTWPKLDWTGEAKADRKIADNPFYRELSYRDMAKKLGHGSNYAGKPFTLARHAKLPPAIVEEFQSRYFSAFPGILLWQRWVAQRLGIDGKLTTPFGRTRNFFGRHNDDSTLREAIAFIPQSSTGDRLNLALWRVWKYMPQVQLLCQVHDALYFQYPEELEEEVVGKALALMNVSLTDPKSGRSFYIPGEAKVGWNWGNFLSEEDGLKLGKRPNPWGLKKYKGPDLRKLPQGLNFFHERKW